jgi:choline kinase
MKAIILVAGKGSRLAPYTDDRPKCMILVGGRSILDHQLDALAAAGVLEVVLVVGCMQEMVKAHLAERSEFSFTFIENERYAETNTAYSLWLARWEMTDDFIYMNGDVLIHPEVIRRLIGALAPQSLAVERKTCGDEEVKVLLNGCRITALSKTVPPADAYGEFIGIAHFSRRFGPAFRASLEEVIERDQLLKVYFELALERLLVSHVLTAIDISDLPTIEIDFPEDLQRAEIEVLPRIVTAPGQTHRILFYIERNLHVPFLEPIFDVFKGLEGYESAWCTVPYLEPTEGHTGMGLEPLEMQRLGQKGRFVADIAAYAPDVTICADACTHLKGCGKVVFVGHGMISKGGFYTDSSLVRRENRADLICVPGPLHREVLQHNVFKPIAVTGFVKADTLYGPNAARIRDDFRLRYNVPVGYRVILFAPTFNEELSAIPCVGVEIGELCDEQTILLIKLHTMTDVAWVRRYRELATCNRNIRFVDDIDASPAMLAADLLISDVSSVVLEFMFLDKPVIVVNNPRMREYPYFLPNDIEYQVRDACLQVTGLDELKDAVIRSWADPGELSKLRMDYARDYSYGRDGKSVLRIAQAIHQLMEGGFDRLPGKPSFSIITWWEHQPTSAEVEGFLQMVESTTAGCECEIHCLGPRYPEYTYDLRIKSWLNSTVVDGSVLNKCTMLCKGEYLLFTRPGLSFPSGWPVWLSNHFRFASDVGAVMALSDSHNYQMVLNQMFSDVSFPNFGSITDVLLSHTMGLGVSGIDLNGPCVMIPREKLIEYGGFDATLAAEAIQRFGQKLLERKQAIIQAIDVFCYEENSMYHPEAL